MSSQSVWTLAARDQLAALVSRSGIAHSIRRIHMRGRTVARVVNYHSVPEGERDAFERQLEWFDSRFSIVPPTALADLLDGQTKANDHRPALLLTFDDGLKSHANVVAPTLERRGLSGWFFIPTGLIGISREDTVRLQQALLGRAHEVEGEEVMMNWSDVERISEVHAVGSHTVNHVRLGEDRAADEIAFEVEASREELERRVGKVADSFCWVGGELESYGATAYAAIEKAGYRYSFMTNSTLNTQRTNPLQINRSNVEAFHPIERVDVVLSGINDIRYLPKRLRVRRRVSGTTD